MMKKLQKFQKEGSSLLPAIILIGTGGMIGQLMLVRVLMVIFLGNELSLSLVIASWLLFEGLGSWLGGKIAGSETLNSRNIFLNIFSIYPVVLLASVFLARHLGRGLPGLIPGEALTLGQMFFISTLTVGVTGILHGSLFPLVAEMFEEYGESLPVSRTYILEIIGTIGGGLVFSLLLAPNFTAVGIAAGLISLHLPAALLMIFDLLKYSLSPGLKSVLTVLAGGLILLLIIFSPRLHELSIRGLWPEGSIEQYRNSPYGNITTVSRHQEQTVFYDGRPMISLPHPDEATLKDYAYLVAASHPKPENILLVGGGLGGIIYYLLDHPLEELVFAEIDPELIQVMRELDTEVINRELGDERTSMKNLDGRLYLNRSQRKFDLIMLGMMEPDTLQTNRFYTREFFDLVDDRLEEEGVLALTLPGSPTYLGDELALLNGSIYHTADEIFAETALIPGGVNIILASQEDIDLDAQSFINRLKDRDVYGGMISSSHLEYRLDAPRVEDFNARMEETSARINRDFSPAGFLYGLLHWSQAFAPEALRTAYRVAENIHYLLTVLIFGSLLAGWRFLFKSSRKKANRITFAVAVSGSAAMTFDVFTLFSFQSLFGHIYQLNGLFIAAFMGGMFLGGRLSINRIEKAGEGDFMPSFLRLELAVLGLLLVFPLFVTGLRQIMALPAAPVLAAVFCVIFAVLAGGVVGAQFPLAVNILPDSFKSSAGVTAGRIYTADLIGGWLAGILIGIIIFPLAGLTSTLFMLAGLKLVSCWFIKTIPG